VKAQRKEIKYELDAYQKKERDYKERIGRVRENFNGIVSLTQLFGIRPISDIEDVTDA
jgi:hypothetical protein